MRRPVQSPVKAVNEESSSEPRPSWPLSVIHRLDSACPECLFWHMYLSGLASTLYSLIRSHLLQCIGLLEALPALFLTVSELSIR